MGLLGQLATFAKRAAWAATGSQAAGRALVRDLGDPDENVRTIAGILVQRAGRRAKPLLLEALARREALPNVLLILGDLGDPAVEPQISKFTSDPDPRVARAAADALQLLAVHRRAAESASERVGSSSP